MNTELPFESPARKPLTISQLTALIKETLEKRFVDVCVVGEISDCKRADSGHVYLTLKDEGAVLRAVMWRGVASRVKFQLADGLEVVVRGNVDVYAPRGSYQLIISDIHPKGLGALQLAFRQLVDKLEKEGLFRPERKRALPRYPRRIGIVTSPTGAAIRDMTRMISRRWPLVEVYLLPRRVQGEGAAEEIAAGIQLLNAKRPDLDIIIVGRGGGSLEDLWAFNEEIVARAIHASRIPIVSAVGHEVDVSISDLVADVRAATPTDAGTRVVPDREEEAMRLANLNVRMARAVVGAVRDARQRLAALASRRVVLHPEAMLQEKAQSLDETIERMHTALRHGAQMAAERLASIAGKLDALSPLKVLGRGYSITFGPQGRVLCSPEELRAGDAIMTRLLGGEIQSTVASTRRIENPLDKEGKRDG